MSGGSPSPLITKRGRCRSPGINSSKMTASTTTTPGTRCLVFLRRCLAIQLQKVGSFPNNLAAATTTTATTVTMASCANGGGGSGNTGSGGTFDNTVERDAPLYWMYDSGYLIFQGFLEANLKCFWNGALMEAMKVLEFQGYIAPGVLLVNGSPCALEVVRAAWARNVLKPPNNYVITVVGDVEDCLVEPISQGQFTPLPEALCWIILDMTASGQAAVMESICSMLEIAFPDIQKPSKQLIYDTLAKLMAEKKLYQTSYGYFVMTPDKMRLSGLTANKKDSCDSFGSAHHQKPLLLTPEEAVVMIHGEIETVRDGNVTHQAIQTNLADVICGGNPNDKILYPRMPARIRSGYSAERLERRHSLRFFGHVRRSHSLQRTGSVRHVSDKSEKLPTSKDMPPDEVSRKHTSLFSRLFRRSGRVRRDDSPSPSTRATFSAQFPPPEWFNRGVTHLHSVGTQTTYLAPSTDTLPKRNFDYDFDDELSLHEIHYRKRISALGTPRTIRRTSATLPRRSLKKASTYGIDHHLHHHDHTNKDTLSRISSQNSVTPSLSPNDVCGGSSSAGTPYTGSHSSLGSAKTVISKDHHPQQQSQPPHSSKRSSPTHKSMSSASSGYNSLPRSVCGSVRNHGKHHASKASTSAASASAATTSARPKSSSSSSRSKERCGGENSITVRMSAKSSTGYEMTDGATNGCGSTPAKSLSNGGSNTTTTKTESSATTMTINSGPKTKIFVQQHNTPTRSLITFENGLDKDDPAAAADIIIVNQPFNCENGSVINGDSKESKPIRPSSLYVQQQSNNAVRSHQRQKQRTTLDARAKKKYPSSETIQLEEKLSDADDKLNNRCKSSNVNVLDDSSAVNKNTALKNANLLSFSSDTELNNAKNYLISHASSNVDKINNLKPRKNVLTTSTSASMTMKSSKSTNGDVIVRDNSLNGIPASPVIEQRNNDNNAVSSTCNDLKHSCKDNVERELENLKLDETTNKLKQYTQFPSLSDLSLRFTSLAAQSILKGVSYNSVDTLVEVNMAAEKKRNCEMNISTDLGVV